MTRAALLLLALPLAACNAPSGNISIQGSDGDGNVTIHADGNGQTTINVPGIDAKISLPKINIDEKDFDVNGMKLYPGSKITDFNVDAQDSKDGKDNGRVRIAFDAPASVDKVQAWFRDGMAQRGFKVSAKGSGFAGTTDKGDPITLELNADGTDKAKGVMEVGSH